MRYLRYAVIAVLGIVLLTVAIANRDPVVLRLLPLSMAETFGGTWAIQVPLFVVILGGAAIGLLVGFTWEWLREHRHRKAARQKTREAARLEQEMAQLRKDTGKPATRNDEIVALLETGVKAR